MKHNFDWTQTLWLVVILIVVLFALVLGASLYAYGFQNGQYTAESLIHTYGNCTAVYP